MISTMILGRSHRTTKLSRYFKNTFFSSQVNENYTLAIVGSGPSAFYTAKYLIEKHENINVDMYEKLPVPYGLVRYGVAPDHPEVKTVIETFNQVASLPRFRYFGNIEVSDITESGKVSVHDLISAYSGVILAYGAAADKKLGIKGEDANSVLSSRDFVNWYNGHPEYSGFNANHFDLSRVKDVAIVGNGNVALDCARILTKSTNELAETDISQSAIEELQKSNVENVHIIGRRGHVQAAFTIKELRELTRLNGVDIIIDPQDLKEGLTESSQFEIEASRPKKRITDLINSAASVTSLEMKPDQETMRKKIHFHFLLSPIEVIHSKEDPFSPTSIICQRNKLVGAPQKQTVEPIDSVLKSIPVQLVIMSVGYKSEPISQKIPFDPKRGNIPHANGRVLVDDHHSKDWDMFTIDELVLKTKSTQTQNDHNEDFKSFYAIRGLYVTGWLKRGPTGIIASNVIDAKETAASILEDITERKLKPQSIVEVDRSSIGKHLQAIHENIVHWNEFENINQIEEALGAQANPVRPRVKILNREDMVQIAKQ